MQFDQIAFTRWRQKVIRFSEEGIVLSIGVLLLFLAFWFNQIAIALLCAAAGLTALVIVISGIGTKLGQMLTGGPLGVSQEKPKKALTFDDLVDKNKNPISVPVAENTEQVAAQVEDQSSKVIATNDLVARVEQPKKTTTMNFRREDFVDSEIFKGTTDSNDPSHDLDYSLNQILATIKDVLFAHTVAFFWIKKETNELVLESKISDSDGFSTERKFSIQGNFLSKSAFDGEPGIVAEINPQVERDLAPYYGRNEGIRSMVSVPVYFLDSLNALTPIGLIIADSKAVDAFGEETVTLLARFTKILSSLIKSSTRMYDLMMDFRYLESERRLRSKIFEHRDIPTVVNELVEETSLHVAWDAISVCLSNQGQTQWSVVNARVRPNAPYVSVHQVVDLHDSLAGRTISSSSVQLIPNMSATRLARFHPQEPVDVSNHWQGAFLSIPIATSTKCYGSISFETMKPNAFVSKEGTALRALCSIAAIALEFGETEDFVKEFVVLDEVTNSLNQKSFLQRLQQELQRSDDEGKDLACVLVSIGSSADLTAKYGKGAGDFAARQIARILQSGIRVYDVIGRIEPMTFGICLVNTDANEGYLWSEKIRSTIAASLVEAGDKKFSVTASFGVASALEGMPADTLIANAAMALKKAEEAGGNIVRVY